MSVARSYAKAFFEASPAGAGDNGTKKSVASDRAKLEDFWKLIQDSKELRVVLLGPATSSKEKIAVVSDLAKKQGYSEFSTKFLQLLARKGRMAQLGAILVALDEVRMESQGGILGSIVSADVIAEKDVEVMEKAFGTKLGKKVELRASVDKSLLAGVKVTVSGVTYDGTLRAQLQKLREAFVQPTAGRA